MESGSTTVVVLESVKFFEATLSFLSGIAGPILVVAGVFVYWRRGLGSTLDELLSAIAVRLRAGAEIDFGCGKLGAM